jgi:hypothetical protein
MEKKVPLLPTAGELVYSIDSTVTAAIAIRDHLNRSKPPPEKLERVTVTRLLNPGQAYYDVTNPLTEELDAFQRRMAGTGAHDILERILGLPSEEFLDGRDVPGEPSLERITGKLDARISLPDGSVVPVEIKNVAYARGKPSSSHLEQLGMYCAMLSADRGLLFRVLRDDKSGTSSSLAPVEVTFRDLTAIREEMVRRRDLLTEAVELRDPSRLPACAYVGNRCKYKEAGICNCKEREDFVPTIEGLATWHEAPEFLEVVQRQFKEREAPKATKEASLQLSTYALLTPRKVYFRSCKKPEPEAPEAPAAEAPEPMEAAVAPVNRRGLETQLYHAIRGVSGRRYSEAQPIEPKLRGIRITAVDGHPVHVKIRMVRAPVRATPADLTGQWGVPEDVVRIAIEAILLGQSQGRLYVWNWKLEDPGQKLQVFDLRFRPEAMEALRRYLAELPADLEDALAHNDPHSLPLCPRWMCEKCEFLAECRPDEATGMPGPD